MKVIYFDCTNGISGDMVSAALYGLLEDKSAVNSEMKKFSYQECSHSHYEDIRDAITESGIRESAKEKALSIYLAIAEAEAAVHGTTVEDVHFHEVGRYDAVMNIVKAAVCVDFLGAERVFCSEICDGKGFIECSHGRIPVPVPAVMAMREGSDLVFTTDESVGTEMVTPSGLAVLIGLKASCCGGIPQGEILGKAVSFGKRKTGRDGGFTAYLIDAR